MSLWIVEIFEVAEPEQPMGCGCIVVIVIAALIAFGVFKCTDDREQEKKRLIHTEAIGRVSSDYTNKVGKAPITNSNDGFVDRNVTLHDILDTPMGDDIYPSKQAALVAKLKDNKIDLHPKFKNNSENWRALIDVCMQGGKTVADNYINMYVKEMKDLGILSMNWSPPNKEYLFLK